MQPPTTITSLSNPAIKQARALRQRKARVETGLFLVEGLHHIGEALEAGWEVERVFHAPDLLTSSYGSELVESLQGQPGKLQPVSAQVIESLAEKDNPQGLVAVIRQRHADLRSIPAELPAAALVSPQDPGNVGTILRSLDAVGAGGMILVESNLDLFHPSVVRASMGSLFWKPVAAASMPDFVAWAHGLGRTIIGSSAHAKTDLRGFTPSGPWVLLLGSEQKGLTPEQLAACDRVLSLPMRGRVSSLNLAVAAGIMLYALTK